MHHTTTHSCHVAEQHPLLGVVARRRGAKVLHKPLCGTLHMSLVLLEKKRDAHRTSAAACHSYRQSTASPLAVVCTGVHAANFTAITAITAPCTCHRPAVRAQHHTARCCRVTATVQPTSPESAHNAGRRSSLTNTSRLKATPAPCGCGHNSSVHDHQRSNLVGVVVGHVVLQVCLCLECLATKPTSPMVVAKRLFVLLMHCQPVLRGVLDATMEQHVHIIVGVEWAALQCWNA